MLAKSSNGPQRFLQLICVVLITILLVTYIIVKQVSINTASILCLTEPNRFRYDDFKCYQFPSNVTQRIDLLEDITESERQPTKGKSIFFFETSCAVDGLINIDSRFRDI